jgi:hypothetical protein
MAEPRVKRLVVGLSLRRPGLTPSLVRVGFVVVTVALLRFLYELFVLFAVLYCYSVLTHVSSEGWTVGAVEGQFHRNIVAFHRNNRQTFERIPSYSVDSTVYSRLSGCSLFDLRIIRSWLFNLLSIWFIELRTINIYAEYVAHISGCVSVWLI